MPKKKGRNSKTLTQQPQSIHYVPAAIRGSDKKRSLEAWEKKKFTEETRISLREHHNHQGLFALEEIRKEEVSIIIIYANSINKALGTHILSYFFQSKRGLDGYDVLWETFWSAL